MLKQVVLLKRRPGMTLEEFREYYETRHSLLGLKYMPLALRYFRRYVKPEPNPITQEVVELDFDVITEIWWESREHFESTMRSLGQADINAIFREDEKHIFASHGNAVFTVEEFDTAMPRSKRAAIGVRSFAFIPKGQGVTDDEFAAYWRRVRPQRSGALAAAAGMSQSLLLEDKVDESPRLFNGVIEAWDHSQSAKDLQRALSNPAAIYDESTRFMDLEKIVVLSGEENIVQWGPAHLDLKNVLRALWVVTRKPGMSVEAFHDYWRHTHGPMVPRTPSLVRYIQYHVSERQAGAGMPEFDGVAELSWNNVDEYRESWESYPMQREQHPDMPNFLDLTQITGGFFQEIWRSPG